MTKLSLHPMTEIQQPGNKSKWKLWLKRIGVGGFIFFLVKGLVWIAIFAGLIKAC